MAGEPPRASKRIGSRGGGAIPPLDRRSVQGAGRVARSGQRCEAPSDCPRQRPLPATTGHLEMTGIPFIAPNHEWVAFAAVTADGSLDVYRRGSRAWLSSGTSARD